MSFYRTQDGYLAREKGGVDAQRIKNNPAFQRTRENGSEFGRAGKAGRTLRTALRVMLQKSRDSRVASRLTKEMVRVVKSDDVNARGERLVSNGDLALLNGFDFNINGKLRTTWYGDYGFSIDRAGGSAVVNFQDFVPVNDVVSPSGATHMQITAGAAVINFEEEGISFSKEESPVIPINGDTVAGLALAPAFGPGTDEQIFLVLGIEFLQEVNGQMYPLRNGAFNPLTIVLVDQA